MNEKIVPKYFLGQVVGIKALGLVMNVAITKRVLKTNLDNGEGEVFYDFEHQMDIPKKWHWQNISEEYLESMIKDALYD